MGKRGKKSSEGKKKPKVKKATKKVEANPKPVKEKKITPNVESSADEKPTESLADLTKQRDEIKALLSSLEDAYNEATILEDDYNDIKVKNDKRLREIEAKISKLSSEKTTVISPSVSIPVPEPRPTPPPKAEPAPAQVPAPQPVVVPPVVAPQKPLSANVGAADLQKLEQDLAEKVKVMVEQIGIKLTQKDLLEMRTNFTKYETEIERMKAQIQALNEMKKLNDEKSQRLTEGIAEVRTIVYGREASNKEQEIKFEKVMDIMNRLEPDKIMVSLQKVDKRIGDEKMRIDKLEETSKELGNMLRKIEKLLIDIGSLENVIKVSNDASEKLVSMQNIERTNYQTMNKIQGIYAELSKRMEEFMLYRAKQDRVEDLMNDVLKNMDDINTKLLSAITKEDLDSFRKSITSSIDSKIASSTAAGGTSPGIGGVEEQKEEIKMLMKTMEEEYKSGGIQKEEYEQMKKTNLDKIKELEKGGAEATVSPIPAPEPLPTPEKVKEKPKKEEKKKEEKKEISPERKSKNELLLKDLEETFKKGFISKAAYEKTKKIINS